jgi:hypothetical protein
MQAILKGKHQIFCNYLQSIKNKYPLPENELVKLEEELNSMYEDYQREIADIKMIITEYNQKQQEIKNKIKQLLRKEALSNGIKFYSS